MTRRIFITVAEVSGDKHAAQLIRELAPRSQHRRRRFGRPGNGRRGRGHSSQHGAEGRNGLGGLLRAFEVYKLLKWTRGYFDSNRPDLWIGVDSPSMNFHLRGSPTTARSHAAIRRAATLGVGHLANEEITTMGRSGSLHPAFRGEILPQPRRQCHIRRPSPV